MTRFRPAKGQDLQAVIHMMDGYYAEDGYPFDRRQAEDALRELIRTADLGRLWVAVDGETVVGYLAVTLGYSLEYGGRDAFVDELFIHQDHRRRGLGREALEVAEAFCQERGVKRLHLEVEAHRQAAARLYRRLGFAIHDRILMSKRLDRDSSTE